MFVVYGLFCDEEIFYVGKTTIDRLALRLSEHKSRATHLSAKRNNQKIYNKIRKLLSENKDITIKQLFCTNDESIQNMKEIYFIKLYGKDIRKGGKLYNSTNGGEGITGYVYTDEVKKKMSEAKMGHTYLTGKKRPDMVKRFSKKIFCYDLDGNFITEFASQRIASKELNVNFKLINSSAKSSGKTWCEKLNQFIRFNYTKHQKIEAYKRKYLTKKVWQYTLTGDLIKVYDSVSQASRMTGFNTQNISATCRGEYKTAYGYVWKYNVVNLTLGSQDYE